MEFQISQSKIVVLSVASLAYILVSNYFLCKCISAKIAQKKKRLFLAADKTARILAKLKMERDALAIFVENNLEIGNRNIFAAKNVLSCLEKQIKNGEFLLEESVRYYSGQHVLTFMKICWFEFKVASLKNNLQDHRFSIEQLKG